MKNDKLLKIRLLYIKLILKVYKLIKNILPGISNILRKHIEKISLKNSKELYNLILKNLH